MANHLIFPWIEIPESGKGFDFNFKKPEEFLVSIFLILLGIAICVTFIFSIVGFILYLVGKS